MILKYLIPLLAVFSYSDGYKYLLTFPGPVKSLNILGEGHVKHLLDAGHEVTYITAFPIKNPPKINFRQIDVSHLVEAFTNDNTFTIAYVMENKGIPNDISKIHELMLGIATGLFKTEAVKKLLEDPNEHFDAIISDYYEVEIYCGLSVVFNCPMIWSYSMGTDWNTLWIIDEPTNPAYTHDYMSSNTLPFSFQQRVEELWTQIHSRFMKKYFLKPIESAEYQRIFKPLTEKRGLQLPNFEDHVHNVSLIFGNEHHATGNLPKTPQNFKFIAGFHIDNPAKPLPKDLQTLMDNAKHGVIYFSMGSTWRSKDIPVLIKKDLLKLFGGLKQTVIWKYEDDDLQGVPENVHIIKWAPQPSILAHPKLLFFITHGGLLSSIEVIHFAVPAIAIPVYFDQFLNTNKAVSKGYAIKVDLSYNLTKDLEVAIEEMLTNNKYKENVRQLSAIYHDRPIAPGKEVIHWAEHAVRTKGAPHLRSPALMVPWYQKMYLDLVAVILFALYVILNVLKSCFSVKSSTKIDKRKKH